jgi:hypothetical protein
MKKNRTLLIAVPLALLLIGLVIYQYGYLGIQETVSANKEEEDLKVRTLQKYLSFIAEEPDLQRELKNKKEQRTAEKAELIAGDTTSLAAASLQEMVKGIITSRGGVISSERVGKEEEIAPGPAEPGKLPFKGQPGGKSSPASIEKSALKRRFRIIKASFDFTAPEVGALRDIVFFIETKVPSLVIRELDCRVRNFQKPKELMIRMEVSALYGGQ